MTARRRLLAVLTVGAAVVPLAGCERPAPIVTVVSGTHSEWKEADVYCFEGQATGSEECASRAEEPTRLPVSSGQQVGVDVSKPVAERGWYIELSAPGSQGQSQRSEVFRHRHYFAFTAPNVTEDGLQLTVHTVGEQGEEESSGEWTFELVPE